MERGNDLMVYWKRLEELEELVVDKVDVLNPINI